MEQDHYSLPGAGSEDRASQPDTNPATPAEHDHPPVIAPYRAAELQSRRLWLWSAGFVGATLVAAVLGGLLLKVPYVALVPGSAKDTEPLLAISGVDEFPSEGELLFTTVRVRQRPNLWEYLWLKSNDDATVLPEEDILGGRTPEENREFNLSVMNDSKQIAVAVALEELGYDAVKTDAVVVQQLVPEAPAEQVLVLGDSILAIDGQPTTNTGQLVELLSGRQPGDEVALSVERFGETELREISVVLDANPERPDDGFLGIQPADRPQYLSDFGFSVAIDSGSVGGPSAGLAFTLAVLDQLTEGELTGGMQIAVTGTISASGDVGPVGGVLQKTAAVSGLGADVFIIPARLGEAELDAIAERAGDDLKIIPVNTLEEALDALAGLGGDIGAVDEYAAANAS
ncbi:MAG: YlbL family protein [Acidimicrobiales bacterium]